MRIDKSELFRGNKGTYLDLALIGVQKDKYDNDFMVVQSISKERREKGEKGPILGNGKIVRLDRGAPASAPAKQEPEAGGDDEDFPF